MSGVNKIILMGKVGRTPVLAQNKEGSWLCFTLITSEVISKTGVEQEFKHNIRIGINDSAGQKLSIKIHDILFIEGKLRTYSFTDHLNIKRYKTEVIASHVDRHS